MSLGPVIIFDKSTLQGISTDESVWLENYFVCNITPIFYAETLADIEKNNSGSRNPIDIVRELALKTPEMESYPNVFL